MNQRNVDALEKAMRGAMGDRFTGSMSRREVAEYLANLGCLGPAKEVLTPSDHHRLWLCFEADGLFARQDQQDFPDALDAIAKGISDDPIPANQT